VGEEDGKACQGDSNLRITVSLLVKFRSGKKEKRNYNRRWTGAQGAKIPTKKRVKKGLLAGPRNRPTKVAKDRRTRCREEGWVFFWEGGQFYEGGVKKVFQKGRAPPPGGTLQV